MKKLKIYLDTSVINFLFADDSPNLMDITKEFFENFIKQDDYDIYISKVVNEEIRKTRNQNKKQLLLNVIEEYNFKILEYVSEIDILTKIYIDEKIIPINKIDDARHIAYSTYYQIDIQLSWNFKHLANV